ncbi:hypothetical protein PINS_up005791 [Pythium insidiosum]|nr:hypothetical protein PINS_up005791 [Pythium insidiosum]
MQMETQPPQESYFYSFFRDIGGDDLSIDDVIESTSTDVSEPGSASPNGSHSAERDAENHSSESDCSTPPRQPKKRKSTYRVRKEEMTALLAEVMALQPQLTALLAKKRRLEDEEGDLPRQMAQNALLSCETHLNMLRMAGIQSLMSEQLASMPYNPLSSFHSSHSRSRAASRLFAGARGRMHQQSETFETENGDIVNVKVGTVAFPKATSVEQVHNAFVAFFRALGGGHAFVPLGLIDVPHGQAAVAQIRLVDETTEGVTVETNVAAYVAFYEKSELCAAPHGLAFVDSIECDDLFPYSPMTRLRQDVTGVTIILPSPAPPTSAASTTTSTTSPVMMTRWAQFRLHRPTIDLQRRAEEIADAATDRWCHVLPRAMQQSMNAHEASKTT